MVSRAFIRDISSSLARKPSLGNQEVEATSRLEQSLSSLSSRATAKATSPPSCALLGTSQCRISPWREEEWRWDVLKLFSDVGRHGRPDERAATGTNSSRASPSHAPQFKVHLVSSHHSSQSKWYASWSLINGCMSPAWSSITRPNPIARRLISGTKPCRRQLQDFDHFNYRFWCSRVKSHTTKRSPTSFVSRRQLEAPLLVICPRRQNGRVKSAWAIYYLPWPKHQVHDDVLHFAFQKKKKCWDLPYFIRSANYNSTRSKKTARLRLNPKVKGESCKLKHFSSYWSEEFETELAMSQQPVAWMWRVKEAFFLSHRVKESSKRCFYPFQLTIKAPKICNELSSPTRTWSAQNMYHEHFLCTLSC